MKIKLNPSETKPSEFMQLEPCNTAYWYLIGPSSLVSTTFKKVYLLDKPIVLYRDKQGVCKAYLDYCPHRGVPLSSGKLINDSIRCRYHGWEFDSNGICQNIPSMAKTPPFCLKKVWVNESSGFIFLSLSENPEPLNETTQIPRIERFDSFYWHTTVRSGLINALENFLDATHTPYVHQYLIRSPQKPQSIQAKVERFGKKVRILYTGEDKQQGLISKIFEKERSHSEAVFEMPSVAEINYYSTTGLSLKLRAYVTPTHNGMHSVHLLTFLPKSFIPSRLKYFLIYPFFWLAFRQDKSILEMQCQNSHYFKDMVPIIIETDLIRRHLVELIIENDFSKEEITNKVILV